MENEFVRKQIVVEVSQEKAFKVFTEKFDKWWPRQHHIGKAEMKRAVIEPKINGRWFEIGEDGSECEWGKVLAWNPFERFILAWQINGKWQFDPSLLTEVEVTFEKDGDHRTRVTLEHRNLERFGLEAREMKKSFDSEGGWTGLLHAFAEETRR